MCDFPSQCRNCVNVANLLQHALQPAYTSRRIASWLTAILLNNAYGVRKLHFTFLVPSIISDVWLLKLNRYLQVGHHGRIPSPCPNFQVNACGVRHDGCAE